VWNSKNNKVNKRRNRGIIIIDNTILKC
jgi:hypothetical protein